MADPMKLSHAHDLQTLISLWQFKALSTSALAAMNFQNTSVEAAYRRLLKLEKFNLIKSIASSNGCGFVWTLQKKGFDTIRDKLGNLKEDGFKTEHLNHDALVSAFHLGNFLGIPTLGQLVVSEQQLRKIPFDFLPNWIPRDDRRRPDGYWKYRKGDKDFAIALEVELTCKKLEDYDNIGTFYDQTSEVIHVVWLVKNIIDARYIYRRLEKSSSRRSDCHSFILLSEYMKDGWHSCFQLGKLEGKPFQETIFPWLSPTSPQREWKKLIDFRKKPVSTNTSTTQTLHDFF